MVFPQKAAQRDIGVSFRKAAWTLIIEMGLHSKKLTMEGHFEPMKCNSALNCELIRNN